MFTRYYVKYNKRVGLRKINTQNLLGPGVNIIGTLIKIYNLNKMYKLMAQYEIC